MNGWPFTRNASKVENVVIGSVSSVSLFARDAQLVVIDSDAQQLDAHPAALDASCNQPALTENETTVISEERRQLLMWCSSARSWLHGQVTVRDADFALDMHGVMQHTTCMHHATRCICFCVTDQRLHMHSLSYKQLT